MKERFGTKPGKFIFGIKIITDKKAGHFPRRGELQPNSGALYPKQKPNLS